MQNIDNVIEIKRGLHRVCDSNLVNIIADLNNFEEFYHDIFLIYDLTYNTETIRQKRIFVAAITKYFILERLPKNFICLNKNKYEIKKINNFKKILKNTVDVFYAIYNTCNSNVNFKQKYAEYFNEEIRDFSKEISENRDDNLSDFAKTIKKIYYSKDKKGNC